MDEAKEATKVLRCSTQDGFTEWLSGAGGSLAISTYQAGRLVLVGWNGQQVSVLPRQLPKPMGLALDGDTLAVACKQEITFFANAKLLAPHYPQEHAKRYDALYLPRATYFTGDVSAHDLAFGEEGLWFVNTRFSCLSLLSRDFSFQPKWHPRFISQLAPEDRCHVNGMAMQNGRPKFVTAHGTSDEPGKWRDTKTDGGVLIDVDTGDCVVTGLAMPHSPRFHDDKLWLLNSGKGELCCVDPDKGDCEVVCVLPGYVRGLSFTGHFALVGLSKVRSTHLFDGMGVQDRFDELFCGAAVVDLKAGRCIGIFEFTEGCDELYDVKFLPGVICPSIINQDNPAAKQGVTAPEFAYWLYEKEKDGKAQAQPGPTPANKREQGEA